MKRGLNKLINWKIGLGLIIFLSIFLRFWQLGNNPPSLTWDEAAWGYNAYSLGIDGRDEFGRFLPHDYLESFGDFKPPLYAYLDIVPVKLFGLNEFAVRFPSSLFGVLTVIITYFLTKRIFSDKRLTQIKKQINTNYVALLSALFLAISPWHVNLSRAAFEANIATAFLVAGVWLFLGGVQEKKWYLPLSIISFVLSIYTFNTARVVAPLLFIGLTVGFYKQLLERKREILVGVFIGLLLVLPIAKFLLSPQASLRFKEVNIFSDILVIEQTNREIANDGNVWWSRILHNRRLTYGVEYLKHYFDHFNPSFLFIKGDGNPKFSTQDVGQLYLWDLPFIVAGILFLLRKREGHWWIIPLWLILGIVPAATARETPHALRIETTLPTWQILVAYGFYWLVLRSRYYLLNMKYKKYLILTTLYLILSANFIYYFHGYHTHYPREFSGEWQYGYKEAISFVQSSQGDYDKVFFTENLGRPYIYFLFYTREDPVRFRSEVKIWRETLGFVHVDGYGKYRFAKDLGSLNIAGEKVLFVDIPSNVNPKAQILKTFSLLNGEPVLVAYTL